MSQNVVIIIYQYLNNLSVYHIEMMKLFPPIVRISLKYVNYLYRLLCITLDWGLTLSMQSCIALEFLIHPLTIDLRVPPI